MSVGATALVILAGGAEEMEVTIIVDVLRRGGVEVTLAGLAGTQAVECSRGVRLLPDRALAVCDEDFDAVVLPGGLAGSDAMCASVEVGELLRSQRQRGGLIAAICAAPKVLVAHQVAAGVAMTGHPSVRDEVQQFTEWRDQPVIVESGLVTSQGPGTAFEFALALVGVLIGEAQAEALRVPMCLR